MKMDHPDQIKVTISRNDLDSAKFKYRRSELAKSHQVDLSIERERELALMKELDMNTKVSKAGVDCYAYKNALDARNPPRECFVQPDTPLAPNYHFTVPTEGGARIDVQVRRHAAGYHFYWYADKKNIYRAKEIDAAIWRLLEAWNVWPINVLTLQDNPKNLTSTCGNLALSYNPRRAD